MVINTIVTATSRDRAIQTVLMTDFRFMDEICSLLAVIIAFFQAVVKKPCCDIIYLWPDPIFGAFSRQDFLL